MRAAFNSDCFVNDVTFDACSRCQTYLQPAYTPNDAAVDDDIISDHFAFDGGPFTNSQQMRANVTFDLAFHLDIAGCLEIAGN